MRDTPDLRLLFPTDFSEACLRAGRSVVQLARACRIDVTIAHVVRPGGRTLQARRALESFLPELSRSCDGDRVLLEGADPADTIVELCGRNRFDLVLAPPSARRGLSSWLGQSFRARLLRRSSVPLWTGSLAAAERDERPISTVACFIDFDDDPGTFLRLVSAFARRFRARFHVLSVIPPIDDGTLAEIMTSDAPLVPDRALSRIRELFADEENPVIDVAVGSRTRELRRMAERCQADVLFVGPRLAASGFRAAGFPKFLDRLPCPVVCLDGAAAGFRTWSFEDEAERLVRAFPQPALLAAR